MYLPPLTPHPPYPPHPEHFADSGILPGTRTLTSGAFPHPGYTPPAASLVPRSRADTTALVSAEKGRY